MQASRRIFILECEPFFHNKFKIAKIFGLFYFKIILFCIYNEFINISVQNCAFKIIYLSCEKFQTKLFWLSQILLKRFSKISLSKWIKFILNSDPKYKENTLNPNMTSIHESFPTMTFSLFVDMPGGFCFLLTKMSTLRPSLFPPPHIENELYYITPSFRKSGEEGTCFLCT
jgi:hypothetical protein